MARVSEQGFCIAVALQIRDGGYGGSPHRKSAAGHPFFPYQVKLKWVDHATMEQGHDMRTDQPKIYPDYPFVAHKLKDKGEAI